MALKLNRFDPADSLENEDDILAYLEAAMEGNATSLARWAISRAQKA